MKQAFFFLTTFVFISFFTSAQITVDPTFPIADEAVTITLNTVGTGLEDYTGDVYTHTGLTIDGNPWQYVIGEWGINSTQPKLTKIGDNLFELEITPTIREYYGAGATDDITELSFVFRSSDGTQQTTPDIFYEVFEPQLSVLFTNPAIFPVIVQINDIISVEWSTLLSDSSFLYIDDQLVLADTGSSFNYDINIAETGKKWVKAVAKDDTEMVADSFYYYVRSAPVVEDLPDGIRDGINYIDDNTVVLCLYAPEKEFVFAYGDFSNWEVGDENYMKKTPDGNRFWIEINNLEPNKQYIFQYYIDGLWRVGDMYCEQVSDPWNDHYIDESTYPDLPEYPYDKTEFIASVLQTAQDKYQWKITDFTPPKKTDLVIYELLIRDFTANHDFNTLIDTLDYLDRLGVNAIELMPTNEFEGNSSWGYNPNYYFAVDKYYGHRNTLKAFIDECHSRGIAVIVDIVLNHSYLTSPFNLMYYDWEKGRPAANSPWYNEESNFPHADANWGDDFNHESMATQALVDSINSYWMSEYKADGFRFDFTKGFSNTIHGSDDPWGSKYDPDRIAILKRMADEIWERNEYAYVIFEHLAENSEEKELANYGILLWGKMTEPYNEGTMGYNTGGKSDFSWISYKKRGWNDPQVVGYMESHDEQRLMYKNVTWGDTSNVDQWIQDTLIALKRQELAAAFFFTIPGPKMIWQFGERGYDYSINYNPWNPNEDDCRLCEKPPRWDYMENWNRRHLYYVYQALIDLKINEDVFETDNFELSVYSALKRIKLQDDGMSVVVIGNFGVVEGEVDPNFHFTGTWYDYFGGEELEVLDVHEKITLQAGEYKIYTSKKLDTPDFVNINENIAEGAISDVILYPNPATSQLNIEAYLKQNSDIQVNIYDLHGRKIKSLINGRYSGGMKSLRTDISAIHKGFYFVVISADNQSITRKLLIN